MLPRPVGYGRYVYDVRRAQTFGATPKEERHWKIAGIEYCGMPAQELKGATAVPGGVAYTSAFYGFRYVIIPWWVPVTLSSLLPLVWACGYASWRRRERRARLIRDRICLRCGYDLRESRGRCPECGEVIIGGAVAREAAT